MTLSARAAVRDRALDVLHLCDPTPDDETIRRTVQLLSDPDRDVRDAAAWFVSDLQEQGHRSELAAGSAASTWRPVVRRRGSPPPLFAISQREHVTIPFATVIINRS
jgi:hypothetical protein